MLRFAVLLLAGLSSGLAADTGPTAEEVFQEAVRVQGARSLENLRDARLSFTGHIHEEGIHTVERTYWYRTGDRSFRIRTRSKANAKIASERGVLKRRAFWERITDRTLELSRRNRDDAKSIKAIEKDRKDFERILRMVMLARLDDDKTKLTLVSKEPVRIPDDQPYEAKRILGKDRQTVTYHVLDVQREGEARLRAFIRTDDHTVRKVIQYHPRRKDQIEFIYYFAFTRRRDAGLYVPAYFAVHEGTPRDAESRKKTIRVRGRLSIDINLGLEDADFKPPAKATANEKR